MKDDLPYFSHDNDARNHAKMKALRARYGWTGYGQFWALNEMISGAAHARLDLSRKVVKAGAACELGMTPDALEDFLKFLSDYEECGLIHYEKGIITTDRTQENYERVEADRLRKRGMGVSSTEKRYNGAEESQNGAEESNKLKETKEDNRIEKNTCTSYSTDIPQDSPEEAHAPIPEPEPEEQEPGAYPKAVYAAWEELGPHVYQPASLWAFSQKWSVQVRPHLKGIHSKDVLQALENLKAIYDAPPGTYYWTQKIGIEAFFSKHLEKFLPANFNPDDFKKRLSFIEQQEAETRASYLQVFGHEMGEEA